MLVEEIDRLHIELWHARIKPSDGTPVGADGPTDDGEEPVASSLHARLKRVLRRSDAAAGPVEQSVSEAETDTTASVQAWIAALRREK
jgi:hypothetical protein